MARQLQDAFFRKAKSAGFLARSAYKLLEIQEKFRVMRPEGAVLDLGCFPGAWLQAAAQHTRGRLVGIDLKECPPPPGVSPGRLLIMCADARELSQTQQAQLAPGFQAVLSDMCHSTTGAAASDVARSLDLGQAAASLALGPAAAAEGAPPWAPFGQSPTPDGPSAALTASHPPADEEERREPGCGQAGMLLPGGSLVIKLLEGAGTAGFAARLAPHFRRLRHFRPRATRRESREVYLVGLGRRGPPAGGRQPD